MGTLDEIKANLEERIKASRVSHEVESISGQAWAGSLWRRFVTVGLDAVLIWAVLLLVRAGVGFVFTMPPCSTACFSWGAQACCSWHPQTLLSVVLLVLIVFGGNYFSTRCRLNGSGRFQNSALLTVYLLLSFGLVLSQAGISNAGMAGIEAFIFFASFYGYRLASSRA